MGACVCGGGNRLTALRLSTERTAALAQGRAEGGRDPLPSPCEAETGTSRSRRRRGVPRCRMRRRVRHIRDPTIYLRGVAVALLGKTLAVALVLCSLVARVGALLIRRYSYCLAVTRARTRYC